MGELQIVTLLSLPTFFMIYWIYWEKKGLRLTAILYRFLPPSKKTPRFFGALYRSCTPSFPPPRPIPTFPCRAELRSPLGIRCFCDLELQPTESLQHLPLAQLAPDTVAANFAWNPARSLKLVGSFGVCFTKNVFFKGRIHPNTLHVTGICTYTFNH